MPWLRDPSCKNWPHGHELRGFLLRHRNAGGPALSRAGQCQHCEHPWAGAGAAEGPLLPLLMGSGKCYVRRTQELLVSGPLHASSMVLATLRATSLSMASSVSCLHVFGIQDAICSHPSPVWSNETQALPALPGCCLMPQRFWCTCSSWSEHSWAPKCWYSPAHLPRDLPTLTPMFLRKCKPT